MSTPVSTQYHVHEKNLCSGLTFKEHLCLQHETQ